MRITHGSNAMPERLPPLYALQAFAAAAAHGSFTGAATHMHLTQSAVSRQVQLLEAFYGCPLFVRQARGLALTAEGAQLLPSVEEAFRMLGHASARLVQSAGILTVQLPPTLAVRWFLPRLPRLREALPGVDVRLGTHWAEVPDFSRSDVDAIIAHGPGGSPNLVEVPLMREHLTPMCAPALLARLRTPADLAGMQLLHPSPHRREWAAWLGGAGAAGVSPRGGQVFDTLDMCLTAAARGQGIAIADPAMLSESLDSGVLAAPFPLQVASGMTYFLTYPAQRATQRKLAAFKAWLLDQFDATGRHS
jgi:LysR family glycine cleavage system transcriptional activator